MVGSRVDFIERNDDKNYITHALIFHTYHIAPMFDSVERSVCVWIGQLVIERLLTVGARETAR